MDINELFSVRDKVAIVTGGSRGIGFMIARALLMAGARVYTCSRRVEELQEAAAALSSFGKCVAIPADLSVTEGLQHFVSEFQRYEKHLNILINNAGTAWAAPIDEYPESGFDKVMTLSLRNVFFLTQRLLPLLRQGASDGDPARVVNIGSVDGLRPGPLNNFAYSAVKAGVHMLTRHLAKALVADNVNVNCIAPGLFPSRMTEYIFHNPDSEGILESLVPMRRPGAWEDIGGTVIYLSSRAGAYLTGVVIPVAGGVSTID